MNLLLALLRICYEFATQGLLHISLGDLVLCYGLAILGTLILTVVYFLLWYSVVHCILWCLLI